MKTRKRILGEEHPSTLTSMNNLAFILRSLKRRQSSLNLMTSYAATSVRVLGATHPDTVDCCRCRDTWGTEVDPVESAKGGNNVVGSNVSNVIEVMSVERL